MTDATPTQAAPHPARQTVDHDDGDNDHTRHSGSVVSLPDSLDLGQLRTQAKELRRGARGGRREDTDAFTCHHPRGAELVADAQSRKLISLRDAQLTLARRNGFDGWGALVENVGRARTEDRDLHRFFGSQFNNETGDLFNAGINAASPQSDQDLLLSGAYASMRHWLEVGTPANHARAEATTSRACTAVGLAASGERHARRALGLLTEYPDLMADWDAPFAHEALGRALAASGGITAGRAERAEALRLTAACANAEDRAVLEGAIARGDWYRADQA